MLITFNKYSLLFYNYTYAFLKQTDGFRNVLYEADKRMEMFNQYVEEAIKKDGKTRELKGLELVSAFKYMENKYLDMYF